MNSGISPQPGPALLEVRLTGIARILNDSVDPQGRMNSITRPILALLFLATSIVMPGCTGDRGLPDRTKKIFSQNDEELVIRDFFDDRRGGFFVDVGSYHWEEMSTTAFLDEYLGWNGLAIDAQLEFAEGYRKFRPRTRFFNHAVTDRSGETMKLYLAWGLSSLDPGWLKNHSDFEGNQRAVDVTTITLNDLLTQNQVRKIDFLSMDIEGGELAALAGFDIERYAPDLVCVEVAEDNREAVAAYFERHNYERIADKRDTSNWYLRPRPQRVETGPATTP